MKCQDEDTERPDGGIGELLRQILAQHATDLGEMLPPPEDIQQCEAADFGTRMQQALYRADRTGQCFVLVLLEANSPLEADDPVQLVLQRIRSSLRKSDSLLQLGTGRFAILLDGITDPDTIPLAVEKILHTLDPTFMSGAIQARIQVRAGASVFPDDGYLPASLWAAAQTALDSTTGQGADKLRFANTRQYHKSRERLDLCRNLYRGMRNREFETAYQPVIDTFTGQVHGVEMLLRWRQARRGLLSTHRFLPLLDETGLIIPVGEWLMDLAFRQAGQLREAGHREIRFSVNLSERQWFEPGFAERLEWLIRDRDHDPELLGLECAEAVLMRNLDTSRTVVRRLADAGIAVSIDRFGGNNHALAELMRLPLSGLKIDRGLIRRLPFDHTSKAIIGGILAFADCMGIPAIACGVENAGQLKFLRERTCPRVQGNHIARPMPFAELAQWLPG